MKQLSTKNKISELDNYCYFFRGISFKEKGIFNEAKNSFNKISKRFKFYKTVENYLGQIALEQNEFKKAISYFKEFEYLETANYFNIDQGKVNHNLGICYLHLDDYTKAEYYLLKSTEIQEKENDTLMLIGAYGDVANLYYNQFKDNLALPYFEKAYRLSKKVKRYDLKKIAALNLAVVEENNKNFEKAIEYRKEAEKWNDSLTDQNKIWAVADVEKKFAIKQKQKEIEVLEIKNEIRETQRNGLFIIALLLLSIFGIGVYFYRQKIKRNKIILAQKENLDELNATKDKLFSIVSHDLRSSVNGLKSSNSKLMLNLKSNNYEQLDELIHQNAVVANSTYNLLDNLLNWANQQTNQIFFQKESLHLFSILKQVEYNYKPLVAEKNIELKIEIDKNAFVFMDLDSLKIVLRNLLDNSLKYTNEKGMISIFTQNNTTETIQLIIEDTGIGMSAQVIVELLQESTKLSKKNNKEIVGTGLGMQLCKSMLQKNGGKINIQSQEGMGTTIILTLPKQPTNE
ncbi:sensor histidine kinase [Flavobacterium sp. KDG-16]|uniref:histidine kinase n=2 Tax=Flavobacterium difficile TaxID=2709659 RepID=A0ABX0I3H3_9FLAO|nr:sensor histidine kinase [Flavobacterium difficile]